MENVEYKPVLAKCPTCHQSDSYYPSVSGYSRCNTTRCYGQVKVPKVSQEQMDEWVEEARQKWKSN